MAYDILREYLIHCYLYYTCDKNIINDHEFDALCLEIRDTWWNIDSPWKEFVFKMEGGNIKGIKGSEISEGTCPVPIQREAGRRLEDHEDTLAFIRKTTK